MDIKEFLEHGEDYYLPNLSIDIVIIGYQNDDLKCLLLKIDDKWLLPGGYIKKNESVDVSTNRILMERTGLKDPYLKFLSVYGDKNRKFSDEWKTFIEKIGLAWKDDYWINNRFVSHVYYSLVDIDKTHPKIGEMHEAISWFSIDTLPDTWLDHKSIVMGARNRLKADIKYELVTYNLLPDHFTMPELHKLHQTILEEKLERSRFQKKILATDRFDRLPRLIKETPGRNPYLYRVKLVDN